MVSAEPNETQIEAKVLSVTPLENRRGAWSEMVIERARQAGPHHGEPSELQGQTLRVFVPEPLLGQVRAGTHFEGRLTVGGPQPVYSLVPPPVQRPPTAR
jgi:hypothetical protein